MCHALHELGQMHLVPALPLHTRMEVSSLYVCFIGQGWMGASMKTHKVEFLHVHLGFGKCRVVALSLCTHMEVGSLYVCFVGQG